MEETTPYMVKLNKAVVRELRQMAADRSMQEGRTVTWATILRATLDGMVADYRASKADRPELTTNR